MAKTISGVMADAMELSRADRTALERFLRVCNRAGLDLEPQSIRDAGDAKLWSLFNPTSEAATTGAQP